MGASIFPTVSNDQSKEELNGGNNNAVFNLSPENQVLNTPYL